MKAYRGIWIFWDYASQWQGEEGMQKILMLLFCWHNQIHCIPQCKVMQVWSSLDVNINYIWGEDEWGERQTFSMIGTWVAAAANWLGYKKKLACSVRAASVIWNMFRYFSSCGLTRSIMDSTVPSYCPTLIEEGKNNCFFSSSLDISGCYGYCAGPELILFHRISSFYKNGETDFADILVSQCLPFLEKTTVLWKALDAAVRITSCAWKALWATGINPRTLSSTSKQ